VFCAINVDYRHHCLRASAAAAGYTPGANMAAAPSDWVLPEKYTDDLKDENGNPLSKR
jgi:hypothetical protein